MKEDSLQAKRKKWRLNDGTQAAVYEETVLKKRTVEKKCLFCGKRFYRAERDNYFLCKNCREENLSGERDGWG